MPVRVRRGATVREADGLAMSSRNAYLSAEERAQAVALSQGLAAARAKLRAGERSAAKLIAAIRTVWKHYELVREDNIHVVDPSTLAPMRRVGAHALIVVAARVGPARLIDNLEWRGR
jgi:pantoate--beta-alanine ligase